MVKAINKNGVITTFNDLTWKLMSKNNGWELYDDKPKIIEVPDEIIEFKRAFKENKKPQQDLTLEEMKASLVAKKVKFDSRLGYSKIKLLYDDYSK